MLLEDHELPLVEATALVRTGSRLDPQDKVGLANLAATVLRTGGTEKLPADALDDYLEGRAAAVEASADEALVQADFSSLKKDYPDVLKTFADVLRHPAFDEKKLEVAKSGAIANVARRNDSPEQIAYREIAKLVYGEESPYGWSDTWKTLGAIHRDDLVAWHKKYFHPDQVVLGLVGDFDRAQALALVRDAFGDWQRGPATTAPQVPYRKQPTPGVFYVAKDDMTQSMLILGTLGIVRRDPDHYATQVLDNVLSGSFASRLINSIRTKKGLSYDVYGYVGTGWDHPGLTALSMHTKTGTTGAGIEALLAEVRDLKAHPPTEKEVANAKESLLNAFVFNFDSRRKTLLQQLYYEYYGYPPDWLARYSAGIQAVTPAQVRDAAAKYLRPEELTILVVGPSKGMDRPLSDFGKVTNVDVSLPPPPKNGAP